MNEIRQEISLDSNLLKNISLDLATNFENHQNKILFNSLFIDLQKYHLICIDHQGMEIPSIWITHLRAILTELEDNTKYPFGQLVKTLLQSDLLNYFIDNFESKIRFYPVKLESGMNINIEIAKQSVFKLLISNDKSVNPEINVVIPEEFCNPVLNKNSILLKYLRSINFKWGDNLYEFKFLTPYLYFSDSIEIFDKYLLKDRLHIDLIFQILSMAKKIKRFVLHSNQFENDDKILVEFKQKFREKYDDVELVIRKFIKSHPRRIKTNYSRIEITNTFNTLERINKDWKANSDISFSCSLET